ncbi:DNA-dependent RNA polymerase [Klebsormidium nitens]|uniref:DNA-dependent RNA polymerase n=1 Tax=Klebsormidium nitens TaxID=105231 RepID=A0A1Y1HMN1_KLENI|nr:DNA-dependent RNA polymerase [Klebsormidium nitens]|eukprot:GAQ79885.1 DNA-dependent RNA polymerase [Klebsormidium nitens]
MPSLAVPYLRQVQAKLRIEMHPSQAEDVKVAVREHLNTLLMRYNEEFGGVVLAYSDVVLLGRKGRILTTLSPYIHLDLTARLLVFAPAAQNVLAGSVNKVGPAHIGLLALGAFNASIRADEIGDAFQYDPDASAWVDGSSRIAVGTEVDFAVDRVHDEGNFLSLSGSLLLPGTGPRTLSEAREAVDGAADATQSASKRKRKKAEQTPVTNGLPKEKDPIAVREPQEGQADEPAGNGTKKKKRRKAKEGESQEGTSGKEVSQEFRNFVEEHKRKGKDKSKL